MRFNGHLLMAAAPWTHAQFFLCPVRLEIMLGAHKEEGDGSPSCPSLPSAPSTSPLRGLNVHTGPSPALEKLIEGSY